MTISTSGETADESRLRSELRPVAWRLGQAIELLRGSSTDEAITEGRWRLEEVYDLLSGLASEQREPELASRLARSRDTLSGHLAAALDCAVAHVRSEVVADVLSAGAAMVAAELDVLGD